MPSRLAGCAGRQRRDLADSLQADSVQARGPGEILAAVYHAMADAMQFASGDALHDRQQVRQRQAMVGAGNHQAVALITLLPVQDGFGAAQAFGQATEGEVLLGFVDQGELDRRTAAVDHQNVACRHLDFLEFIVRPLPGTPAAAEGAAQSGLALFGVEYPGPILPGWSVAHMLSVTTGQDCHPVAVLVLTKINDTHSPFVRVRVAIVGGLG